MESNVPQVFLIFLLISPKSLFEGNFLILGVFMKIFVFFSGLFSISTLSSFLKRSGIWLLGKDKDFLEEYKPDEILQFTSLPRWKVWQETDG